MKSVVFRQKNKLKKVRTFMKRCIYAHVTFNYKWEYGYTNRSCCTSHVDFHVSRLIKTMLIRLNVCIGDCKKYLNILALRLKLLGKH